MLNRNVDQPYKFVGTWLIDEWSKIGVHATQKVVPTGPWFQLMRSGNFDVVVEANCNSVVNPVLDTQKYLPHDVFVENYGGYDDPVEADIYNKMLHETDQPNSAPADARSTRSAWSTTEAHEFPMLWWNRVIPERVLRERLEDRPEPLHQPGPVRYLAGQDRDAVRAERE